MANKVQVIIGTEVYGLEKVGSVNKELGNMKDATSSVQDSVKSLRGQVGELNGTMGVLAGMAALGGVTYALKQCMDASVQTERAMVGLAVTARYSGAGMEAAQKAAQDLTKDGLMSVTEASQGLQNLLSRGFSLPEAITLMNRMKDSAAFNRQAHLEFGQSIVGATEGLKNENSVLVDNAGVTKNVSVMWKEYAAEIGKGVNDLTQAEKRTAEYNGILRETEGQLGNAARMTNTYQGAQARLNQQMFDAKSTMGTALQPVLKGTFDMMLPIIHGFRDMVYWVETLGARAGAAWDKLKLRADIAMSGKGMFSKEGIAEFAARSKGINQALDETINDIVKLSTGDAMPDVGKDSGKRRKDTVTPDKGDTDITDQVYGKYTSALDGLNKQIAESNPYLDKQDKAMEAVYATVGKLSEEMPQYIKSWNKYGEAMEQNILLAEKLKIAEEEHADFMGEDKQQNYLGKLGQQRSKQTDGSWESQQDTFDESVMLSKWADARDYARTIDLQKTSEFNALTAQMNGDATQMELFRIQQEENAWLESWAMQTNSFEEFERRKTLIEQMSSQKRIDLSKIEQNQKMQTSQNFATAFVGVTQALYTFSGQNSRRLFELNKMAGRAEIGAATTIMAVKAGRDTDGPVWMKIAAIAAASAAGLAQLAALERTTFSGGGGAAAGGSGGGTYNSPMVTQPLNASTAGEGQSIHLTLVNPIGNKEWFEKYIPEIMKDFSSRNVDAGVVYA